MGLVVTAAVLASASGLAQSKESTASNTALNTVSLAQLPAEAQSTHSLIRSGGPFPSHKDGTTFGNRERLLPVQPRGYYREYTVPTPHARNRGARRIVCGGKPPAQPQICYYTGDHYASFSRIVE
jgi:ribonuclease T1